MAEFWVNRMEKERVMARCAEPYFADHYVSFAVSYKQGPASAKRYEQMKKAELIERIYQLESMLAATE